MVNPYMVISHFVIGFTNQEMGHFHLGLILLTTIQKQFLGTLLLLLGTQIKKLTTIGLKIILI
jgi:hypothetical protein